MRALAGVGFAVAAGETLGFVGESGSGKSVTALAIMRLLDRRRPHHRRHGPVRGTDLASADAACAACAAAAIAMIFQNPRAALNPIRPVGRQIADVLRRTAASARGARARALDMLRAVRSATPRAASPPTRTSSPAACASAS